MGIQLLLLLPLLLFIFCKLLFFCIIKSSFLFSLILIGGRYTLTDVAVVAEDFLRREIPTRVVGIPASQNNNIDTSIMESCLGFDSASKCYK